MSSATHLRPSHQHVVEVPEQETQCSPSDDAALAHPQLSAPVGHHSDSKDFCPAFTEAANSTMQAMTWDHETWLGPLYPAPQEQNTPMNTFCA